MKQLLGTDVLFAQSLPPSENQVDFNQRPLDVTGCIHEHLKIGKQELKQARMLVAEKGRSLVGRDWLVAVKYQLTPVYQIAANECFHEIVRD